MSEEGIKGNPETGPRVEGTVPGVFVVSEKSIDSNPLSLKIDGASIKKYLDDQLMQGLQDAFQNFLELEATLQCGAEKGEQTEDRKDYRNGHRPRKLTTRVGEMVLKFPRLRELAFTSSIVERYQRRECSLDEALLEMYFAGVSTRKVQDVTEALFGGKVSAEQMSTLNGKVAEKLEAWRNRPLLKKYRYLSCDGLYVGRRWDGQVQKVSVLITVGIDEEGYRDVIAVTEGFKEDYQSWLDHLRFLKQRGVERVDLITGDKCLGLVKAAAEVYPMAFYQRCIVHFYRNVLSRVPRQHMKEVADALKAIYAQESVEEARAKAQRLQEKYGTRFPEAVKVLLEGLEETFTFYRFPRGHWIRIRTNNLLERLNKEIRRRTKVVGAFPDGKSALLLITARVQWVTEHSWSDRKYLLMPKGEAETLTEAAA
jgi:transposase-like protein